MAALVSGRLPGLKELGLLLLLTGFLHTSTTPTWPGHEGVTEALILAPIVHRIAARTFGALLSLFPGADKLNLPFFFSF